MEIQHRNKITSSSKKEKAGATNNNTIINDYPILPYKKDFMHIRSCLFNSKFKN
jgi:hypothetical protein